MEHGLARPGPWHELASGPGFCRCTGSRGLPMRQADGAALRPGPTPAPPTAPTPTAAVVAGVAALLQAQAQARVTLNYTQLISFITQNGDVLSQLSGQVKTGARVNAYKAAKAVSTYLASLPKASPPLPSRRCVAAGTSWCRLEVWLRLSAEGQRADPHQQLPDGNG